MFIVRIYFKDEKKPTFDFITDNKTIIDEIYSQLNEGRRYIRLNNFVFDANNFSHCILVSTLK